MQLPDCRRNKRRRNTFAIQQQKVKERGKRVRKPQSTRRVRVSTQIITRLTLLPKTHVGCGDGEGRRGGGRSPSL